MRLSTKARYGTRLMVDLAAFWGQGPVMLRNVAERQVLSKKYLEHITLRLKSKGLISTVRGVKGGYLLARPPAEISLLEVIEAIEGPLELVKCVVDEGACSRAGTCVTRDVWRELSGGLKARLSSISLEELVRRRRQKVQVNDA